MALTRVTSGGIAPGVEIKFDADNTPTTPAVSFEGDANTGMYQPASDEIAFSTAGVERLRIKANGDLVDGDGNLIGGTNPDFDNVQNVVLYVNQSDKKATDAQSNNGGNLNKPFKTIERALLEAARKSVVNGANNDKFEAYTIMVLPGDYTIDNRPGVDIATNPLTQSVAEVPGGSAVTGNLETGSSWRFNPRNGGVIVPRGTSIVGYDLRKTVIRPKYIPKPTTTGSLYSEGSITGDGYTTSNILYDAAKMIKKSRGWIQEQAHLFANAEFRSVYAALSEEQRDKCKRDIGIFIDAIIDDLREGGNQNTFVVGERYVNGGGDTTINFLNETAQDEVTATREIYRFAAELAVKVIHSFVGSASGGITFKWTDDVDQNDGTYNNTDFGTGTGTSYSYGGSSGNGQTYGIWKAQNTVSGGPGTLQATLAKPSFLAGTDYGDEDSVLNSAQCAPVDTVIFNLFNVVDTILDNPEDYIDHVSKVPGVGHQTAIFKVTGGCYFWQMTFKDGTGTETIPSVSYASGIPTFGSYVTPNYSHHRVVSFTYADQRTDDGELDLYYRRVDAWDTDDGGEARQARDEEFQIVGDLSKKTTIDTVNGCSPYIFNCSLRSVLGLCGMHTDGSKVKEDSFKSMVVAQFTGISLQKDEDAYWQPHNKTGKVYSSSLTPTFETGDSITNVAASAESVSNRGPIYADPDAEYKHDWRHFHIKASNGSFIQVVSVFAVGYADQFLAISGGDMSITNSNSNFGQITLRAAGSKFKSDPPSRNGKITALIPPRGIETASRNVEFYPIDTDNTWEHNLGNKEDETKQQGNFQSSLDGFNKAGGNNFRIYLEIPGVVQEEDIPEMVLEVADVNDPNGKKTIKRFLTYGSGNNFNLFRDYYKTSGVSDRLDCTISNTNEAGTWTALIDTQDNQVYYTDANGEKTNSTSETRNERIGYFWDQARGKVYLNVDPGNAGENQSVVKASREYIENFLFETTEETSFVTEVIENPDDGSTTVVSKTVEVTVLAYWDGFPGSILTPKLIDDRASTPADLLWRVKYVIPNDITETPKPPEKRFILRGTNPGNDENDVPYTDYAFTVWDVQEIQTWQRGVRDGVYYLTVLRCDIDKFIDGGHGDGNTFENAPIQITRKDTYQDIDAVKLSTLGLTDRNYRTTSNVNYLYPSTNEEGNLNYPSVLWNPPLADSRVITEITPGNGAANFGHRAKDVSVPNRKYYDSTDTNTPFYDVPALASLTAEAVHRLVHAFQLCYVKKAAPTDTLIKVAPVQPWDERHSITGATGYGFYEISDNIKIYGTSGNEFRFGSGIQAGASNDNNTYGLRGAPEERLIPCISKNSGATNITATLENDSPTIYAYSPTVPLLRPSILRASSHTWEYVGIGPGNYSTGFPNLQTRVLKAYEQFIAQGYENSGGFVASSGTNSAGDFYIGNQVIQAGGQSTTTLNVPKVRKSSESNAVDFTDIENRIANNVINVIPSVNKSSAQQDLLKGLSNFFTTARLTVTDTANIQKLAVIDQFLISNNNILNGAKFPEGGPEGYGFVKGARPEKTGTIATDTNDRLYVSPKYLDAWKQKKKILSASNVNLDNNRMYVEPLSRTLSGNVKLEATESVAFRSPITFQGDITNVANGATTARITFDSFTGVYSSTGIIETSPSTRVSISDFYVGMKIGQQDIDTNTYIEGECEVTNVTATYIEIKASKITAQNNVQLFAADQLVLLDTSGMPPFGRVDIEMSLEGISPEDYIQVDIDETDGSIDASDEKYFFNPFINISLQYDKIDYTNNIITVSNLQNFSSYYTHVTSVLPSTTPVTGRGIKQFHEIIKNYQSPIDVLGTDDILNTKKYLQGDLGSSQTVNVATILGAGGIDSVLHDGSVPITITSALWNKLPTRGCVTIAASKSIYTTYAYVKFKNHSSHQNKIYFLRRVQTKSLGDASTVYNSSNSTVYFTGCKTYVSYGDKWSVEGAFIPSTETITEDIDIESATLYTLPAKPIPYTGKIDEEYTDSIVPNPVTSKALGANLQTKRTVKTFQPFENLKQVADFAQDQGFTSSDVVEVLMKPGYYRLYQDSDSEYDSNIIFPCVLKINGSGVKDSGERFSKDFGKTSVGNIGGYSLTSVKSGDSVSFYRSPKFRNNWNGRTDLLYINNIGDRINTTGGLDLSNVHFLGLNEAITRNEILDNAYSSDEQTITARRRVRKAWYVKQSAGFPEKSAATAQVEGGLVHQVEYNENSASVSAGKMSFTYFVDDGELSNSSGVLNTLTKANEDVTTDNVCESARYLKITIDKSNYTGTGDGSTASDEQRFYWLNTYLIPGTTVYYMPNATSGDVESTTKKTRILDLKKHKDSNGDVNKIDVIIALYNPSTSNTSSDEDMDLVRDLSGNNITDLSDGIRCVFSNRDGDEFVTLTYNWCLEKRRQILPNTFTTSGQGYDPEEFDEPEIFGIIAGGANSIVLVIDNNPNADIGAIKSINRTGSAPSTDITTAVTIADDATGVTRTKSDGGTASTGTNASFEITSNNGVYSIEIVENINNDGTGEEYEIGDIIKIPGNLLTGGATPANDLTITVRSVVSKKKTYPGSNKWNFHPSVVMKSGTSSTEECGYTIGTYPEGTRRLYGRANSRYYLVEVVDATPSDNAGVNTTIKNQVSGYNYNDMFSATGTKTIIPASLNGGTAVTINANRLKTVANQFKSDDEFLYVAKYNLSQAAGYREGSVPSNITYTKGKKIFSNYAKNYKATRKKFPTSTPPSVGNLGATLIKVDGVPGIDSVVKLQDVTIGALSDASDRSNTYGGGYYGGIIAIQNGQVELRGVRFRGNLVLDWSSLLSDNNNRLTGANKFAYGHSVDLIETAGNITLDRIGSTSFKQLNVSKSDVNFKYYTMYRGENNLFLEPNTLPTGEKVDYDQRSFPITTIQSIPKIKNSGTEASPVYEFNKDVTINEKYLTNVITPKGTLGGAAPAGASGKDLRLNNGNTTLQDSNVVDAHPDGSKDMPRKSLAFSLPYGNAGEKDVANELAANIYPNFTEIIRNGNPDSVLATVTDFQYYTESGNAFFQLQYSGNVNYEGYNDFRATVAGNFVVGREYVITSTGSTSFTAIGAANNNINTTFTATGVGSGTGTAALSSLFDLELQLLTKYIPSQRFNYIGTLTTRYKKVANAKDNDDNSTNYSRYEIAFDEAQNKSKFANNKDIDIRPIGAGLPSIIRTKTVSGETVPNIIKFVDPTETNATTRNANALQVLMETDSSGNLLSLDIVSLGINNTKDKDLYYSTESGWTGSTVPTTSGFKITIQPSVRIRLSDTDIDYEVFEPGEVCGIVANNTFIVNNFTETSLTGIKSALQKAKSVISPGNYIKIDRNPGGSGGDSQYYKIAQSEVGKPYLGIYRYVSPDNEDDIRTSLVIRLEESTYNISYNQNYPAAYDSEMVSRFDIFEDDNILRYWPEKGRLNIGELELAEFTKAYTGPTLGYQLTINRSNTSYWPSVMHDWDGIEINETFGAGTGDEPAEAPPAISVNTLNATTLTLADPVDITASTYKRIGRFGKLATTEKYFTKSGYLADNRTWFDIPSVLGETDATAAAAKQNEDIEKLEIGQIVSVPFRNMMFGRNRRGTNSVYNTWPDHLEVTVLEPESTDLDGTFASVNKEGDIQVVVRIDSYKDAGSTYDEKDGSGGNREITSSNNGEARIPRNLRDGHQIVNPENTNSTSGSVTTYANGSNESIFTYFDPLAVIKSQTSKTKFLGRAPNATGLTKSVTNGDNTFTITQNEAVGVLPDMMVVCAELPGGRSRITGVTTSDSTTYTVTVSENFNSTNASASLEITNASFTRMTLDVPLQKDIPTGTKFKIIPQFNTEGHTWDRHTSIFTSRISDLQKVNDGNDYYIRIYTSDPISMGNSAGSTDDGGIDEFNLADPKSRHYGFLTINHGGWSYPRSGGSFIIPNNIIPYPLADGKLALPNHARRLQAGDTFKYTYEANDLVQSHSGESFANTDRIRLSSIAVGEGDTVKSLSTSSSVNFDAYYGKADTFRKSGSYKVYHVRYEDTSGELVDNYKFGNSDSTNSFLSGSTVSEANPLTRFDFNSAQNASTYTTYYVDPGDSTFTAPFSLTESEIEARALNTFGIYTNTSRTGTTGETVDAKYPWRNSLVRSSDFCVGEGLIIKFNVSDLGAITDLRIEDGGSGYEVGDWIIIESAVFNPEFNRYPKDVYLYVSEVATVGTDTGVVVSLAPSFLLIDSEDTTVEKFAYNVYNVSTTGSFDASDKVTAGNFILSDGSSPTIRTAGQSLTNNNYYYVLRQQTTGAGIAGNVGSTPGTVFKASGSITISGTAGTFDNTSGIVVDLGAVDSDGNLQVLEQGSIFVNAVSGSYAYLGATTTTSEGELSEYDVEIRGGFSSTHKFIFAASKPDLKLVTGTILSVGTPNATSGYSICSIDSPDNILYTGGSEQDWLSVSDVLVSHGANLFAFDGPVVKRIFHSEKGGTLAASDYKVWNTYYRRGSQHRGDGIHGSQGWVGNFGRTVNGEKPIGLSSAGALTVNWGRQRANSPWLVAQPIRPSWTHKGQTTNVVYNTGAFQPNFRFIHTNGMNSFYSSSYPNYIIETDGNSIGNMNHADATSVKKHTDLTTDVIRASVGTYERYLREWWSSGYYWHGGIGPLSYGVYNWSNTFDSISESRIKNLNCIQYTLRDLQYRSKKKQPWGDINWGTGKKTRLGEQMRLKYVQNYTPSIYAQRESNDSAATSTTNLYKICGDANNTLKVPAISVGANTFNVRNVGNTGDQNVRQGLVLNAGTALQAGARYIIKNTGTLDTAQQAAWNAIGLIPSAALKGHMFVATGGNVPTGAQVYVYQSKLARGDALYSKNGSTYTFIGYVKYIGGSGRATIYLTGGCENAITNGHELVYVRVSGLKEVTFDTAISNDENYAFNKGENVISADVAGSSDYNLGFVIDKRSFNTSPTLNTAGEVQPILNDWNYNGSDVGYRSVAAQFGDLSAFDWSLMNINMTRYNAKVHLEAAVTITVSRSSVGIDNVYI